MHLSRLWTDTQVRSKKLKKLSSMPNQAKQNWQNFQRWQRREKQKTLKLKIQVIQLKQPHKKPGFPLTTGRIEHGTLEHPSARTTPYYPICYTCSWHSPPLLVSVATNCLNREGLEPKGYGVHSRVLVHVPKFRERASTRGRKHEQEEFDIVDQVSCAPSHCGERPSSNDSTSHRVR